MIKKARANATINLEKDIIVSPKTNPAGVNTRNKMINAESNEDRFINLLENIVLLTILAFRL